ncbi:MAG TPA: glucosamine-6-phosphate deaminase [Verrucomicrobiae bacterium]|jgi:glucosamine-6-phosphate deaminase|nr:glucosamine-6-phosphate deaminase [Verrucomicrobiae bacterium]
MKITIAKSEAEFFEAAAVRVVAQMKEKRDAVIGLATGRTTKPIHAAVCDLHRQSPFDVSKLTVFAMDEVTNVPREYAGSCYDIILQQIVKPLGIPLENFIMPPTYSEDFGLEAKRFEQQIADRGGIDLQFLGIGEDGHLGFNQPGTPFNSTCWHSRMDRELEARIRRETQSPDSAKLGGLTLGIKNIMQSRKIVLAANGSRKARIIKAALDGAVTPEVPASVLQLHPDCEVILDPAAAEFLS